ncbi:uncharacterized protein LOC142167897 [Nicotiana tabacum]|uniref:Uncharacterized protein LOC142167897 n=1 Tax=Nicotiana tabacum TaxID=4097 RepID=A0AC58SHH5_TOBAC
MIENGRTLEWLLRMCQLKKAVVLKAKSRLVNPNVHAKVFFEPTKENSKQHALLALQIPADTRALFQFVGYYTDIHQGFETQQNPASRITSLILWKFHFCLRAAGSFSMPPSAVNLALFCNISGQSINGLQFRCYSRQLLGDWIKNRNDVFALGSVGPCVHHGRSYCSDTNDRNRDLIMEKEVENTLILLIIERHKHLVSHR